MPKKLLATTIIIALIVTFVVGMQVIEVVVADPFWIYKIIDPIPGTIPPVITIISPLNNTTYPSDGIIASFNVSKPQLGTRASSIIDVTYTLDGETVQAFTIWKNGSASSGSGIPRFNTTFSLPSLHAGKHSLTVEANGVVFAGGESGLDIFFINSNSTTFFTVGIPSTSQPSLTDYLLNPTFLTAIAGGVVIGAVASVSLVYFKRRRQRTGCETANPTAYLDPNSSSLQKPIGGRSVLAVSDVISMLNFSALNKGAIDCQEQQRLQCGRNPQPSTVSN